MTEPPFEAPWHAQAFALTHALADAGALDWGDWTAALATQIARREIATADDYYTAWIAALETLTGDAAALARLRADWTRAYLDTPHGQPVALDPAPDARGLVPARDKS